MADDSDLVPGMVKELRQTFRSGLTSSRDFRLAQLRAFRTMMVKGRAELAEALGKDLHKAPTEAWFLEINQVRKAHLRTCLMPTPVG